MAVIISNGATNLSTAGGFYRAESYNLSTYSTTVLALSTTRQINVTFANAGNCKGLILHLTGAYTNKDVTVELQENTGSWTTRASKTLTVTDITIGGSTGLNCSSYIIPFEFATPYAVDTTASKWRFQITQGTGNAYNWSLRTSNGTAPSYITWCDNAVSYATDDVIIAKETITIDQNCTFKGLLSTGDSTNSICAIACTSTTRDPTANGMIVWDDTPASSYTMNIDGYMVLSAYAGFHIGNSTNRIPYAQKAVVNIKNATSGTATNTGISQGGNASQANHIGKASFQLYGEIPTARVTTLASDANFNQKNIVTTDSTGWSPGDRVVVCKAQTAGGTAETAPFTIDTISGTNITFLENILSAKRLTGGKVFRVNGYGVEIIVENSTAIANYLNGCNGYTVDGAYITRAVFNFTGGTSEWNDSAANITDLKTVDSAFVGASIYATVNWHNSRTITAERCHNFKGGFSSTFYGPPTALKTIKDCIFYGTGIGGWYKVQNALVEDNYVYNGGPPLLSSGGLYNSTFRNNYFWGAQYIFRNDGPFANILFENNIWDYTDRSFYNFNVATNVIFRNDTFGVELATKYIFSNFQSYSPISAVLFDNCVIKPVLNSPTENDGESVDGSKMRFQDYNQTANYDFTAMTYGTITRTGTGLADTTVRTAGGFAMRFEPTYSPNLMHWEQNIPTGNIQNKTMTVSLWVKLNNSAYWAGTHTKPTLTIDYDNGTTITSVAQGNTNWQQLACTFTPTTGYGQIEMKVTGATDATGTDRYFYVDDVNVAYPAGVAIDLGNLDLWAEGLPVAPAIATMPSLGGVWDEPLSAHTIAGTMGKILADTEANSDVTQAKVDQL